jgi:ABC-type lipoprotein release transport system permease subunit
LSLAEASHRALQSAACALGEVEEDVGVLGQAEVPHVVFEVDRDLVPVGQEFLEQPVTGELGQVAAIGLTAFVLTVLATIYPALRGAATEPAEALRYE